MVTSCAYRGGSRSFKELAARGALSLITLGLAFHYRTAFPLFSVALIIAGVVSLRGCPGCWLAELIIALRNERPAMDQGQRFQINRDNNTF